MKPKLCQRRADYWQAKWRCEPRRAGAWRSIAGRNLPGDFEAWPNLSQRTVANLREEIGIGCVAQQSPCHSTG